MWLIPHGAPHGESVWRLWVHWVVPWGRGFRASGEVCPVFGVPLFFFPFFLRVYESQRHHVCSSRRGHYSAPGRRRNGVIVDHGPPTAGARHGRCPAVSPTRACPRAKPRTKSPNATSRRPMSPEQASRVEAGLGVLFIHAWHDFCIVLCTPRTLPQPVMKATIGRLTDCRRLERRGGKTARRRRNYGGCAM